MSHRRALAPSGCDQLDKSVMIRESLAVRLIKQKVLGYGVRKQSYQIATNSEATEIAHTPQLLGIKETIEQEKLHDVSSKNMGPTNKSSI